MADYTVRRIITSVFEYRQWCLKAIAMGFSMLNSGAEWKESAIDTLLTTYDSGLTIKEYSVSLPG